ncbi:MAG: hypothetical protein IJZ23_01150 [Roseburia sp.]|nr:hypothetical protein [Roseburia sp.]
MKKIIKVTGIAFAVFLILFIISIPIVNNYSATVIEKKLSALPLPEQTEYIESVSKAGKMTGNGNGMQYLGAILIESELTLEELDNYYSLYRENEWDCIVEEQIGQEIAFIEHRTLVFDTKLTAEKKYYVIYSWGNGITPFSELDIRGN